MTKTVAIFGRDGCQPCKLTKERFRALGVDTVGLPVDDFPDEYEVNFPYSKELPGVVVHDQHGNVLDKWTGFRPDLISRYKG